MSANPIIYCLERLTDYRQFERLASDLMAGTQYPGLEPIGGTGDGGRDALYVHKNSGITTIFAYSVRSDWKTKLRADCKRISELNHPVDAIVFVSTQVISGSQKDDMRKEIHERYAWSIDYYDIERIRVLLTGVLKPLVGEHPAIFVAPWFERRGGELVIHEQRDLIVIDHLPSDHAFAAWLFGKLSTAGYSVWCYGLAPLVGENADESVRALIRQRAGRYFPVLSSSSMRDANLRGRMAVATDDVGRTVPCWISDMTDFDFDSRLASIVPARFDGSWSVGLTEIERQLKHSGVSKSLDSELGRRIALSTYQTEPLLRSEPETIYANMFPARVPNTVLVHELLNEEEEIGEEVARTWAYVRSGKYLISFASAPSEVRCLETAPIVCNWRKVQRVFGIESEYLIKTLLKRSLFVACYEAGFHWCNERFTFFLEEKVRVQHGYQHVDNVYTNVSLTGERSWGSGERSSKFRYQLGPIYRVSFDDEGLIWVNVRLYVRITDVTGRPLEKSLIPSRRKRVTKSWWNRQWFARTLGIMQFVANGGSDINGDITIGNGLESVSVSVRPFSWLCPVSIDVEALDRVGDFQGELAAARVIGDASDVDVGEALHE